MKSYNWVEKIKEKTDLKSDYAVSVALGITRATISQHKTGAVSAFSDKQCIRIAEILQISAAEVLADQHAEAAKTPEEKAAWNEVVKALMSSAAAVLLAFSISALNPPLANAGKVQKSISPNYILCALRKMWRNIDFLKLGNYLASRLRQHRDGFPCITMSY